MITQQGEESLLKEIAYLDPELNGDAEYFHARVRRVTIWRGARQVLCSPSVITVAVLTILLIVATHLPA